MQILFSKNPQTYYFTWFSGILSAKKPYNKTPVFSAELPNTDFLYASSFLCADDIFLIYIGRHSDMFFKHAAEIERIPVAEKLRNLAVRHCGVN